MLARLLDTDAIEKQDAKIFLNNMYKNLESEDIDFRNINITKLIAKKIIQENKDNLNIQNTNINKKY